MRADRLVATLLLLQARGTVTAREVAEELEVSERTARRDLDALAVAGIPVYSVRGRGGGWRLVGDARTDLTGLRSAEARALMTMAAAAGQSTPEFRGAVAKLTQALPEPIRDEARAVVASIVADGRPWGSTGTPPVGGDRWIEPLQTAVMQCRRARLDYERPGRAASRRVIEPLGLVAKQGWWYLVAATDAGQRTFRLDRIARLEVLDDHFDPPTDFDLAAAWDDITTGYVERSRGIVVEATIGADLVVPLRGMGVEVDAVESARSGERADGGRIRVQLASWNDEALAVQIAGFAGGVDLHDPPPALTERLAAIGRALDERYGSSGRSGGP